MAVPPVGELDVVVEKELVVHVLHVGRFLLGEADALLQFAVDRRVGDGAVVTHVDREVQLCLRLQHRVDIGIGPVHVRRVLRNDHAGGIGQDTFARRDRKDIDARVLPLHGTCFPDDAAGDFLGLKALRERFVGRIDACACFACFHEQPLALVDCRNRAAGRKRCSRDDVLVLDVDDALPGPQPGVEAVEVAGRRGLEHVGVIDDHLARIDVRHAVVQLEGRHEVGR